MTYFKYPLPAEMLDELSEELKNINLYPSGGEYAKLRQVLAEYMGVKIENVLPTNGSDEVIEIISRAYKGETLIPVPTFFSFLSSNRVIPLKRAQQHAQQNFTKNHRKRSQMRHTFNPCLYLVIGPENCLKHTMADIVHDAIEGGVSLVQYRNKNADFEDQLKDVQALLEITKKKQIPLLVNDNVEVALAAKADGVHLGQSDMDARLARKMLGDMAIIGLTVKNMAHVRSAPIEILDYLGIGGVFPTSSKHNPDAPIGLDRLRKMVNGIAEKTDILTTAIAGLDEENCEDVTRCGVNGIAIISSICNSASPKDTAKSIRNKIDHAINEGQSL